MNIQFVWLLSFDFWGGRRDHRLAVKIQVEGPC
jgi:hypothetical protein